MKKLFFIFIFCAINIAKANYPEFPQEWVEPRFKATPYAYVDFSKGQFSHHEYALKGTKSVAVTFGLKF